MPPEPVSRATCAQCGVDTDPLRDPVRHIDGKLRSLCRPCASSTRTPRVAPAVAATETPTMTPAETPAQTPATAPRSADVVLLTPVEAPMSSMRPVLVSLWPTAPAQPAKNRGRSWKWYCACVAATALVGVVIVQQTRKAVSAPVASAVAEVPRPAAEMPAAEIPAAEMPAADLRSTEMPSAEISPTASTTAEATTSESTVPAPSTPAPSTPEQSTSQEPLAERVWVFPVVGSEEMFPLKKSRRFGATREGKRAHRCGAGHCGADLDGARGTPVVAVADGEVARIERSKHKTSGRYVRLHHDDGTYTSYMHLDRIARGLRVGARVLAGTQVGTVGRTGMKTSPAHLHLSLEIPTEGGGLRHIDPVPRLKRATRLQRPYIR